MACHLQGQCLVLRLYNVQDGVHHHKVCNDGGTKVFTLYYLQRGMIACIYINCLEECAKGMGDDQFGRLRLKLSKNVTQRTMPAGRA